MRRRTRSVIAVVTTIALGGLLVATQREAMAQAARQYPVSSRTAAASTSKGMAAISAATRDGKYLFIFLWRENDVQTRSMYPVFQATTTQWSGSTNAVSVQITDPAEKPMVDKFGVGRAPMPLVLALAPNGAVTKAFPVKFNASQLRQAFVSPATARCMKALQERKLVLLCVQNQRTQFSHAALSGARNFKADARFASATQIVTVDPDSQAEATFLHDLKVDPRTPQAVTVLLAPPGQPVATFAGAVSKEQIVAKVAASQSGPCAGGQCGPGGCCGPKQ